MTRDEIIAVAKAAMPLPVDECSLRDGVLMIGMDTTGIENAPGPRMGVKVQVGDTDSTVKIMERIGVARVSMDMELDRMKSFLRMGDGDH